jgi:large subunit ribosomal protein L35
MQDRERAVDGRQAHVDDAGAEINGLRLALAEKHRASGASLRALNEDSSSHFIFGSYNTHFHFERRRPMPKMKTHKASRKRFRVSAKGKLLRSQAGKKHLNSPKAAKRKRQLRGRVAETDRIAQKYIVAMGGKN